MHLKVGRKTNKTFGFTLVELLIVIIVIAILAAISVVAYNGIQQRAENNKTIAATAAYLKAIKMYETDKGEVPHAGFDSCVGENYLWDHTGATSGTNQCRSHTSTYYTIKGALNTALKEYVGSSLPSPSMQAIGTATNWSRGITYVAPSVGGQLVLFVALKGVAACPDIGGRTAVTTISTYGDGLACSYAVGQRLR